MPNLLSNPGYRIETYVKELQPDTAHFINADFKRKEMSELYKNMYSLVREKPENRR